MPKHGSSIGIKKYVPATPAVKRTLKKKVPKPEGSKGSKGDGNKSYFQMLQILSTPTVRKGQSTLDAGMAGLAKGLALANLLGGSTPQGGKVAGGTVLEKTKPTASPLAKKKPAGGYGGFGGVG